MGVSVGGGQQENTDMGMSGLGCLMTNKVVQTRGTFQAVC